MNRPSASLTSRWSRWAASQVSRRGDTDVSVGGAKGARTPDPLLANSFQARGQPARCQVEGRPGCPWGTVGDRSFPPVLARMWHASVDQDLIRRDLHSRPLPVHSSTDLAK